MPHISHRNPAPDMSVQDFFRSSSAACGVSRANMRDSISLAFFQLGFGVRLQAAVSFTLVHKVVECVLERLIRYLPFI